MSQINSGIKTKSCVYDFSKDGALGAGVFAFAGIGLKPGEALLNIKVIKLENFTSGSGGATTFSLGFGPNPTPGAFFAPKWSNTITFLNSCIWNLYTGVGGTICEYDAVFSNRLPATLSVAQNFWFTSSAALTAGKCGFVITYLYSKF